MLMFIFMLVSLFAVLPNLEAAQVFENSCSYKSDDLNVVVNIYSNDSNDNISAKVTVYKFGDEEWGDGKSYTQIANSWSILVDNYSESFSKGNYSIEAYEDYSNFTCPKYILVEDDFYFSAIVSNSYSEINNFMNAYNTERKYVASYFAGDIEDFDDKDLTCTYTYTDEDCKAQNADLSIDICSVKTELTIYEDGKMSAHNQKFFGSSLVLGFSSYNVKNDEEYDYKGTCPEYLLTSNAELYGTYYVSDSRSELEDIITSKGWTSSIGVIGSLDSESDVHLSSTKTCSYNDIPECDNCNLSIVFKNPDKFQYVSNGQIGESVVDSHNVESGNINSVNFVGEAWHNRRTEGGWAQTPFSGVLPQQCPDDLYFVYNKNTKVLDVYVNEENYNYLQAKGELEEDNNTCPTTGDSGTCEYFLGSVENRGCPAYWLDFVYDIIKILVILVVIVLDMVDLVKAIASSNDSISSVAKKCILRLVIAIIILLLPTLIDLVGKLIGVDGLMCGIK